jgi:hypothetical protein
MGNAFAPHLDALERQRRIVDQVMVTDLVPAPPDPLARQRRVLEQIARQRNQGYDRMITLLTGPRDPFAAQRRTFDKLLSEGPLARYERIVGSFNALTGAVASPIPIPVPVVEPAQTVEGPKPDPVDWAAMAMVVHLFSIILVCNWLITAGVNSDRLETLVLDAIGLAIHLYVSE